MKYIDQDFSKTIGGIIGSGNHWTVLWAFPHNLTKDQQKYVVYH